MQEKEMDDIIRRLRSQDLPFNDGLSEAEIRSFEKRIGCTLPAEVRMLYRDHDGVAEHGDHRLFHLMPHEEVIDFNAMKEQNAIDFCGKDIFDVEGEDPARVFWTDFNSNYAGVFVTGPDAGGVFIFDHDDPRLVLRYRSVQSFLQALSAAAGTEREWYDLPVDYEEP
jgi:hypothetical protein